MSFTNRSRLRKAVLTAMAAVTLMGAMTVPASATSYPMAIFFSATPRRALYPFGYDVVVDGVLKMSLEKAQFYINNNYLVRSSIIGIDLFEDDFLLDMGFATLWAENDGLHFEHVMPDVPAPVLSEDSFPPDFQDEIKVYTRFATPNGGSSLQTGSSREYDYYFECARVSC